MRALVPILGLWLPVAADAGTLYDDLGGKDGLTRIAGDTIDNALADPRIGPVFDDTNIPRLKKLLATQICQLSGGPCVYKGMTMKRAHAGLHLREADFNALVEDMETAMDHIGIPYIVQTRLLAILAPMERDVVAPKP